MFFFLIREMKSSAGVGGGGGEHKRSPELNIGGPVTSGKQIRDCSRLGRLTRKPFPTDGRD